MNPRTILAALLAVITTASSVVLTHETHVQQLAEVAPAPAFAAVPDGALQAAQERAELRTQQARALREAAVRRARAQQARLRAEAARRAESARRASRTRHHVVAAPLGFEAWRTSWAANKVANCESGGDPTAHRSGSKYRGKWQMDPDFWKSYGGLTFASRPDLASEYQQDLVAYRGYLARGWQPWTCRRVLS